MSFRSDADKVWDDSRSPGLRYRSLVNCIERYSWLTHAGFQRICADLKDRTGFRFGAANDIATLTTAMSELVKARRAFLKELDAFARGRIMAKAEGRRQPSKCEVEALYKSVSLGASSPGDP